MKLDSRIQTKKHKQIVHQLIMNVINELLIRSYNHDNSKLVEPEVSYFDELTPLLSSSTYGSEEYYSFLEKLKPALDHHYKEYRHHPEHFENKCSDMNIIDVLEMFIDWKASTMRHENGDISKSIEINKNRFDLDNVSLYDILKNSINIF